MGRVSLAQHVQESRAETGEKPTNVGPFAVISRQYGCAGFSLGLLLLEILNENIETRHPWRIYHREILERLAGETNLEAETLQRERRRRPSVIDNVLRSLSRERVPSGQEIRNRIMTIIRDVAVEGYAIIVGQGGAAATHDLPNGMSVRLEAPLDWRVKQVAFSKGLSETQARILTRDREAERRYVRKVYEARNPRIPAFNLVYDCSSFSLTQIAQHIAYAMKLKGCI